jgi:hypothetical protein
MASLLGEFKKISCVTRIEYINVNNLLYLGGQPLRGAWKKESKFGYTVCFFLSLFLLKKLTI